MRLRFVLGVGQSLGEPRATGVVGGDVGFVGIGPASLRGLLERVFEIVALALFVRVADLAHQCSPCFSALIWSWPDFTES